MNQYAGFARRLWMLSVTDLSFGYNGRPVLDRVHLQVHPGQVLMLAGPNGCGKSTLLKCITGSLSPEGAIHLNGGDLSGLSTKEKSKKISYVPQSLSNLPFPALVADMVLLGRRPYIRWEIDDDDYAVLDKAFSLLDIESFAFRQYNELSGGEKQRVLIARALVQEPEVMILDEPTSALDLLQQIRVLEIVKSLAKSENLIIVAAMHDLSLAARYADHLLLMKGGRIVEEGKPCNILNDQIIREVYGVEAEVIISDRTGCPVINPVTIAS